MTHSSPNVTPHSFREALENYAQERISQATCPGRSRCCDAHGRIVGEALAEVERLYAARVGEEYEVQVIRSEYDFVGVVLDDDKYSPGDRVFVTKGDAG